jgi:hypothetical protein
VYCTNYFCFTIKCWVGGHFSCSICIVLFVHYGVLLIYHKHVMMCCMLLCTTCLFVANKLLLLLDCALCCIIAICVRQAIYHHHYQHSLAVFFVLYVVVRWMLFMRVFYKYTCLHLLWWPLLIDQLVGVVRVFHIAEFYELVHVTVFLLFIVTVFDCTLFLL